MMNIYYVTMGVQYRTMAHPVLPPERANPDGFLIVRAENERDARQMVQNVIGTLYANLYREDEFQAWHHPLGCLGEILHGVYDAPGQAAIRALAAADDDILRLAVASLSEDERLRLRIYLEGRA